MCTKLSFKVVDWCSGEIIPLWMAIDLQFNARSLYPLNVVLLGCAGIELKCTE
jgi:hypothetical protein